jgi:DNA-binding transcriptional ArsR family regulator
MAAYVGQLLTLVSPLDRRLLFMQFWADIPVREIASTLRIPVGRQDPTAPSAIKASAVDGGRALTRPIENISDPRYVKALSHPLRVRILAILEERTASPLEISRILRAELGVVSYHVRTLHRLGLIQLERETKVRGATQRHYRAHERPRISNEAWSKAPPVAKQAAISAVLQQINDYARNANAAGGFDRADAHITRTALRLDRQGWERLAEVLMDALREVAEIEEDVRARHVEGTGGELEDVGLVMMLFEAVPFSGRHVSDHPDNAERNSPTRAAEEGFAS